MTIIKNDDTPQQMAQKLALGALIIVSTTLSWWLAKQLGAGNNAIMWAMPAVPFAIAFWGKATGNFNIFKQSRGRLIFTTFLPIFLIPSLLQIGWGIFAFLVSFGLLQGATLYFNRIEKKGAQ